MTVAQLDVALDRPLPQSPDAERAVLGSILINNACWYRINLTTKDFFRDAHRTIYAAMALLIEERKEIDLITLREELSNSAQLEQVGGTAYVASLIDSIPDIANVERYAHIVAEKARLRAIIIASNETLRNALEAGGKTAAEISAKGAAKLTATAQDGARESKPAYDVVIESNAAERARKAEGKSRGIRCGFKTLDASMLIRRKAMTIFSAPSSHGKTTMMLNHAIGGVRTDSAAAIFYSFEMNEDEITAPLLSMMSGVLLRRIQKGETNETDNYAIRCAMDELRQWKQDERFYFSGPGSIRDVDAVHSDAMRRKLRGELDMIFVDHIQLIRGYDDRNREQDIDRIGRALRYIGEDLNVAVVVGSQVNKEREKRPSGRLSNLDHKGGAVIGEHADAVAMFQRRRQDNKADQEIPWCEVVFQIEKNRGHETGDVPMHADMPTQTFGEGSCEENNCRTLRGGPVQQKLSV